MNAPITLDAAARKRFWSHIDVGDVPANAELGHCWIWLSNRPAHHHTFWLDGRGYGVHRISWIIAHGPIPNGKWVLHKCDNPPCVRPAHLFLGSDLDNVRDMIQKGRQSAPPLVRGEARSDSKLTADLVRAMRIDKAAGLSYSAIGRKYNVPSTTASGAINRQNWKHVL